MNFELFIFGALFWHYFDMCLMNGIKTYKVYCLSMWQNA